MTALDIKQKFFLQAMMHRKILDGKEVKQLISKCCEASGEAVPQSQNPGDNDELLRTVSVVNNAIKQFSMQIVKGIGEEDGKNYYALLNTQESAITRMSTNYNKSEMEFFLKLVDLIIESEVGEVTSLNALNLTDKLTKSMSKMDAQELLGRLEKEHWITHYKKGRVSLSPLAMMELDQYMREEFEGVPICKMCLQIVLRGPACVSCDVKLHRKCANRVFQDIQTPCCPGCNAAWSSETGNTTAAAKPSTTSTSASQRRQRRN